MPRVGIMAWGSWFNWRYFWPKPLMCESTVKMSGYQMYRWLKFYICIPVYQKAFEK